MKERPSGVTLTEPGMGEDIFGFITRMKGRFDGDLYRAILGAANEFKEGDAIVGVAAADAATRRRARMLISATRAGDINAHPVFADPLHDAITAVVDAGSRAHVDPLTIGELRVRLVSAPGRELAPFLNGITSDVAACLVKVLTNTELATIGSRIFTILPGSSIGERGYLGARIQPNSPTDSIDDIFWQVMSAFSYAVGDVVIGTNPVSSEPESVAAIERCLLDIRRSFGIEDTLPHSVLAHIDIQAAVERADPGSTGIWFQSLAGNTDVNRIFDLTLDRMLDHAAHRTGKYGLYFETGQGADFTNGFSHGADMLIHESRKYGFARLLKQRIGEAQQRAGRAPAPWVHVNDVAGFIGPEVFRTREQLVRCCMEDVVMAKLQGITIGLDVCTTLHMDVTLDDLDWCLDRIMPCNPAYLMALPTRMDPMLGYLTTSFHDHVRLRHKFGTHVNDAMWRFFQRLAVVDAKGDPGPAFGKPLQVWLSYRRAKGDARDDASILAEGAKRMEEVRRRGVPLAEGHGREPWHMEPALEQEIRSVYADAKKCIRATIPRRFITSIPLALPLVTTSADRDDYLLHPQTGEQLNAASRDALRAHRHRMAPGSTVQIVVSDGLNARAITDRGNLHPYLTALRSALDTVGIIASPDILVVRNGRVRAGYRIGEILFADSDARDAHRGVIHIIGERPGSMHHTFSAYITAPSIATWSEAGRTDHNITRVVSGIAATALAPAGAAASTVRILRELLAGTT